MSSSPCFFVEEQIRLCCGSADNSVFRELQVQRMKSSPSPTPVHKQTIIFDVAGLSARPSRVGLSLFRTTINIDSNYYPERLGHFFIINAGMLFRALWKVISLWIDPKTRAKFHVLGGDYSRTLTKYIDASQLPPALGGCAPWDLSVVQPWDMSVTFSDNPWKYRPLSDGATAVDESEFAEMPDGE